ncbi:hypothetical protein MTO96_027107 [Rhipicephalus appendiculatus]
MLDTRALVTPRRYVCFCNYTVFSSLLITLTIVAMGVLSYLIVPKRFKPIYLVLNFTDEEFENASASSSPSKRGAVVDVADADRDLCSSLQCDREAERILDSVNASMDPVRRLLRLRVLGLDAEARTGHRPGTGRPWTTTFSTLTRVF